MKPAKEILEIHYKKHDVRIAYPDNVYTAMKAYAAEAVKEALEKVVENVTITAEGSTGIEMYYNSIKKHPIIKKILNTKIELL